MGRACSMRTDAKEWCKMLVGKHEGKRSLRRPRKRWKEYIKMDLREKKVWECGMDTPSSVLEFVPNSCE